MFSLMYMWWFWLALMLVFFLPVGYGWGYRGWGTPYPSYIQRRRMERAAANNTMAGFNHQAWGLGGDFIWGLMFFEILFVALIVLWR